MGHVLFIHCNKSDDTNIVKSLCMYVTLENDLDNVISYSIRANQKIYTWSNIV